MNKDVRYCMHSFALYPGFVPLGFTDKVFNEAIITI